MSDEKAHERKKLSIQGRETLSIGKNIDNSLPVYIYYIEWKS